MRQIVEVALTGLIAGMSLILLEGEGVIDRISQAGLYHPHAFISGFHSPSSLGTDDDPDARKNYIRMIESNPETGFVPERIRERELVFARSLYRKQALAHEARNTADEWQGNGPFNVGGRTRALGVDIRNEDIILAGGVSGGMWRSEDGGQHWIKVTHPQSLHSVSCIVQDTRLGKENNWYYGTGEIVGNSAGRNSAPYRGDGIFHSSDNGLSWRLLKSTSGDEPQSFNSQFQYISNIVVLPSMHQRDELLVAAVGAVFWSDDGGEHGLQPLVGITDLIQDSTSAILIFPDL